MKIAIVGATGLVGSMMCKILEELNFPVDELIAVASPKSIGSIIHFKGKPIKIMGMEEAIAAKPTIALFSAGGSVSLEWAPIFAKNGIKVIDNSSAWRMHPDIKLIVPEINAKLLTDKDMIIANPNCSTIQLVMVLNPLHSHNKIKRVVVSTYQSVTGTGVKAIAQLMEERAGNVPANKVYPYPIDLNVIPHIDSFVDNGYTKEEMKIINETKKILDSQNIQVTATAVRIPVVGGHSESVNIEFENEVEINDIRHVLENTAGIIVQDNIAELLYPMPITAHEKNGVFVGRIRKDESLPNAVNLWIVSDNLRKGAATNAVQIALYLHDNQLIN
jgi:aspartate-semialdehyde dehydrogenase